MDNIKADNVIIGKNVRIEPTAVIRGINGNAKNVVIGDNVYIGNNVQIICDDFSIGDFSKMHHNTNVHGYKPCSIGHNAWIGQYSIIDSIGGVIIGNNCGIGAHSQLWSHIKYGDTLEGCNFLSDDQLLVGNDVWFVGHCIVSPVTVKDKAMALAGSVVTKDMDENAVYAGVPAKKLGNVEQFSFVDIGEKMEKMKKYLSEFGGSDRIKIVESEDEISLEDDSTYFIVGSRKYTKKGIDDEVNFMQFLLPDKAKFVPL